MEWSKEKTMKLIELMQSNSFLWNPVLCDSRKDKQKRKEELRRISDALMISVSDITKKIQHLRTQYNRESAKEGRAALENANDSYVSNWYAYEHLHFLKDSHRPFSVLQSDQQQQLSIIVAVPSGDPATDCKNEQYSVGSKKSRLDLSTKSDVVFTSHRDEFSIFGAYIANELRSLKEEKSLLIAKKKIQDVIFEVKMGLINENGTEQNTCPLYTHQSKNLNSLHDGKLYNTAQQSNNVHIEPLPATHTPPTSGISEIIINGACHYSTFKVDNQ